ncbi:MAG: hypothetical protein K2G87_02420, partial [Oscillospiraceae bacterium]|nr:hypothetical protein [Oscillospiraceae bacterium]
MDFGRMCAPSKNSCILYAVFRKENQRENYTVCNITEKIFFIERKDQYAAYRNEQGTAFRVQKRMRKGI